MAADPNNAVFFPATLLFLLRPFSAGARAAHLLWAAAFALLSFAALRKLSLSRFSAAVCAFALAVSGPAMTLASLPTTAWSVALFLPLLAAWGAQASVAGGAVIFGLVVLSGEPAIAGEVLALALAFRLLERRGRWKAAAGGVLAGAAIAMPQIVGAAELIGDTVRRGGLAVASGAAFYSVRPLRLLAFVWPGLFGDVHAASRAGFWGTPFFDAGTPYVSTLAIGTATLALLAAASRHPRGRSFLALSAAAALLSLGRFFPGGARLLALPGLSLVRYPEKWLFFAAVAAVAAAGFGLDRVRSGDRIAIRRLAIAGAAIAAASGIAWLGLRLAPRPAWSALVACRITSDSYRFARGEILDAIGREFSTALAFSAVLLLAVAGFSRRPVRLAAAVALLLLADLLPRTWNSVPLAPASEFDVPSVAVRSVAGRGGRFFFDQETQVALDPLRPMAPTMGGVAFAGNNDIDRFSPRRSFLFGRAVQSLPLSDPRKLDLLRLADVRSVSSISAPPPDLHPWFSTSPSRTVYRLEGGERFRFFSSAAAASGEEEARVSLIDPRRDPLSSLVVEGPAAPGRGGETAAVRAVRRRADREEVDVTSEGGGYLFRSETFDGRWRARVDGRAADLLPADFAFQAVRVPAGRHRVEFVYADPAAAAAMALSLAVLLAVALRLRTGVGARR